MFCDEFFYLKYLLSYSTTTIWQLTIFQFELPLCQNGIAIVCLQFLIFKITSQVTTPKYNFQTIDPILGYSKYYYSCSCKLYSKQLFVTLIKVPKRVAWLNHHQNAYWFHLRLLLHRILWVRMNFFHKTMKMN